MKCIIRRFNNLAYDAMRGAKCDSQSNETEGEGFEVKVNDCARGTGAKLRRERI